jgi:hypothetical protein
MFCCQQIFCLGVFVGGFKKTTDTFILGNRRYGTNGMVSKNVWDLIVTVSRGPNEAHWLQGQSIENEHLHLICCVKPYEFIRKIETSGANCTLLHYYLSGVYNTGNSGKEIFHKCDLADPFKTFQSYSRE